MFVKIKDKRTWGDFLYSISKRVNYSTFQINPKKVAVPREKLSGKEKVTKIYNSSHSFCVENVGSGFL